MEARSVLPLGHAYVRADQVAALVHQGEDSTLVVLISGYQLTVNSSIDNIREALSRTEPAWSAERVPA